VEVVASIARGHDGQAAALVGQWNTDARKEPGSSSTQSFNYAVFASIGHWRSCISAGYATMVPP
jgi:hypothetical protein